MTTLLLLATVAGAVLAQGAPQLRVNMISIGVTDMPRSIRFYTEMLGLALAGLRGDVTMIKAGDVIIALNKPLEQSAGNAIVGAVEIIFPSGASLPQRRNWRSVGAYL